MNPMPRHLLLRRLLRFREFHHGEEGSIFPYLAFAAGILAVIALFLMVGLGDATLHRRDASNAADAAALAAAGIWAGSVESMYNSAVSSNNSGDLWDRTGRGLGSYAGSKAKHAADTYASRNGATVTAYTVNANRRTVTVTVETNSTVEGTTKKMSATSTAEIVAKSGVCLDGSKVGFKVEGECVTTRPTTKPTSPTPTPTTAPAASPTPTPFKAPDGMSQRARVTVRLIS